MAHGVELTADISTYEVMDTWPATAKVFLRHRMSCIGCAMARFCTVAEASRNYDLECPAFLSELEHAARASQAPRERSP